MPGYVIIKAEGIRPHRLTELCRAYCCLYDMKRQSYTTAVVRVKYVCLRRVRRLAEANGIRISVIGKSRFAAFADAIAARWWMLIFAAAAVAAMAYASCWCFEVRINGTDTVNEFELSALLKEQGAKPPFKKKDADLGSLRRAIIKSFPQAAVTELGFAGIRLNVTIGEGEVIPDAEESDGPSAIVAKRGGVIEDIVVRSGEARVAAGQTVRAGDVLIDGIYVKKEMTFAVAARGSITALTDYIGRAESTHGASAATEQAYYDALDLIDADGGEAAFVDFRSYVSEKDGISFAVAVITVREDIGEKARYGQTEEYGVNETDDSGV